MMKRTVCHRQAWVGCGRSKREGKKEWDLASLFVDGLNKSIKAHWSTLIELHKWDWGGTHGKAATKQQQGWADHSFRHFLKLIIHACPSLVFFYPLICPSVFLCMSIYSNFPPTPLPFTAPFINEPHFPSLSVCLFFFPSLRFWASHTLYNNLDCNQNHVYMTALSVFSIII